MHPLLPAPLAAVLVLATPGLHAQAASFPFVQTTRNDPNWVMATADVALTPKRCISSWYDDPESPCAPGRIRYWKPAPGREEAEAVPLASLRAGTIQGLYVRPGHDLYLYRGTGVENPYPKKDACGVDHPVLLRGPYYLATCRWRNDPKNPDRGNFATRTFFTGGASLDVDSLVVAPPRVIVVDIDGLRRDAFYDLLARSPAAIPTIAEIVLGRSTTTGGFLGRLPKAPVFTGVSDRNNEGPVDFAGSFQAAGADRAVTVLPSYTFAAQAALFTASQPRHHGILGNEWFNRLGRFKHHDDFRRGYSGGSGRALNHITRNYEWGSILTDHGSGPCELNLFDISNKPNEFGYGGLASMDLLRPTIYDAFAGAGLSCLVAFNMYTSSRNYHNQPLVDWARPRDKDLCNFISDKTGLKYDVGMVDRVLAKLAAYRQAGKRFPRVLTLYFAGHDHQMHELGNDQKLSLRTVTDPQLKRFVAGIRSWVDPRNFLWAFVTDHGHTQVVKSRAIVVENDLEDVIGNIPGAKFDVWDNVFERDFNVYVCQNGGMALVHVKKTGGTWKDFPLRSDLLKIARACYFRKSAKGGETIQLVLGRDSARAGRWDAPYQVYDPVKNDFVDLEGYLARNPSLGFVDLPRRLREMNGIRSGDLILIPNYAAGYSIDEPVHSTHGSPWGSDSLIPFVFAGRPLQRLPDARRTIPFADQYDLGPSLGGYLGASVPGDGEDRLGPLLATETARWGGLGVGCPGTAGTPWTAPARGQLPWVGRPFTLHTQGLPSVGAVALLLGASKTKWAGLPLPLDLTPLGMDGCRLYVSIDTTVPMTRRGAEASVTLHLPATASLVGKFFYAQALVLDSGANRFGAVLSNGGEGRVGRR